MDCRKNEKKLCTAFTGVAASLLTGGETIHSLFQYHVGKKIFKSHQQFNRHCITNDACKILRLQIHNHR